MTKEQEEVLRATIPYVGAVASYFWRLTSPQKEHTVVRYLFLIAFAYAGILGAYFVAGWPLAVLTALGLACGYFFLVPRKEPDKSAEVRG